MSTNDAELYTHVAQTVADLLCIAQRLNQIPGPRFAVEPASAVFSAAQKTLVALEGDPVGLLAYSILVGWDATSLEEVETAIQDAKTLLEDNEL